ncbi:MAG: hypothetical protein EP340_08230 [Alphaproteobacteria bacterium]|nr:MAG: hypothetical protein EP340_08230 [Alphaproteobacteria bacterium]
MIFRRKAQPVEVDEPAPDARASIDRALRFAQKSLAEREVMASQAIENTLLAIEKAMQGLDAILESLGRAQNALQAAISLEDDEGWHTLKEQYAAECAKINEAVALCTVADHNLLSGARSQFHVPLSDSNKSNFLIVGSNFTVEGLHIASAEAAFQDAEAMQQTLQVVEEASRHAKHTARTYCANAAVLTRHLHNIKTS